MSRQPSRHPTELELAILKTLWQLAPQTVDDVRASLEQSGRPLSHNSVITIMNIMVKKSYLKRSKLGRAFEFSPILEEQQVGRGMLNDLVSRVFDGSAQSVMLELLETHDVDSEELKAIRRLINRKAKENNND